MTGCVVDTSVVLALLFQEPGMDLAAKLLPDAVISTVNLSEIVAKLVTRGRDDAQIGTALQMLNLRTVPFDDELARLTGQFIKVTRVKGLSLGDRACLALALHEKLAVYTTDRAWSDLDIGVDIRQLR